MCKNGAQFLNATSALLPAFTVMSHVTKINTSEQSQRLDLILSVSILIEFFVVFIFCCLTIYNIRFFVANSDSSLLESFSKSMIFCVSILFDTRKILQKIKSFFF